MLPVIREFSFVSGSVVTIQDRHEGIGNCFFLCAGVKLQILPSCLFRPNLMPTDAQKLKQAAREGLPDNRLSPMTFFSRTVQQMD